MAGDANYPNVSLLLPFDGADGFSSAADLSSVPKTITFFGDAKISTTQSKFGGTSLYLDGSGDYLSVAHNPALSLVSGDWTIEAWIYIVALPASGTMEIVNKDGVSGTSYSQFALAVTSAGKLTAFIGNGNGVSPTGTIYTGSTTITTGAWHHVAIVKNGSTFIGFLNGGQEWSAAAATMYEGSKALLIGYHTGQPGTAYFNGYIDDLRITKGIARYTANFTPPAAAFVAGMGQVSGAVHDDTGALCSRLVRAYRRDTGTLVGQAYTQAGDSNIANVALLLHLDGVSGTTVAPDTSPYARTVTFVGDAKLSSAQSKFGASSLALDGSGDYLTVPWSSDFSIEASDFNIAMWVYRAASGVSHYLMSGRPAASTDGWEWRINATNYLQFFYTGGSSITGAVAVPAGQWCLVEVNRSGTSLTMWIDGVAAGSGTVSNGTASTTTTLKIGCDNAAANGFNGWIDEVRFTKGVSRNTVAYTPPTDRYPDNSLSVGNYSFDVPTLDEVNIIAYDDAAGTLYNDQILRVIPA